MGINHKIKIFVLRKIGFSEIAFYYVVVVVVARSLHGSCRSSTWLRLAGAT
jgi:hypothetical protein